MKSWLPALFIAVVVIVIASCQNEQEINFRRYYNSGRTVYQSHCQNCHGSSGEGLGALMPPLTDTVFISRNKKNLACLITNGMEQPLIIRKKAYSQKMPPSGLAPVDVAEVVTYITNTFGNKHGVYTVEQANKDLTRCP